MPLRRQVRRLFQRNIEHQLGSLRKISHGILSSNLLRNSKKSSLHLIWKKTKSKEKLPRAVWMIRSRLEIKARTSSKRIPNCTEILTMNGSRIGSRKSWPRQGKGRSKSNRYLLYRLSRTPFRYRTSSNMSRSKKIQTKREQKYFPIKGTKILIYHLKFSAKALHRKLMLRNQERILSSN